MSDSFGTSVTNSDEEEQQNVETKANLCNLDPVLGSLVTSLKKNKMFKCPVYVNF